MKRYSGTIHNRIAYKFKRERDSMVYKKKVDVTNKFTVVEGWSLAKGSDKYFNSIQEAREHAIELLEDDESSDRNQIIVEIVEKVRVARPAIETEVCNYEVEDKTQPMEESQGIGIQERV